MTAQAILTAAAQQGAIIATAESCTGGGIAVAITDIAGSSAIFDRSFVTYTNAAKMQMLGVQRDTLDAHGAVSEQVASEMALGALAASDATIAISVTGIAGPGGSDFKPEGRVCFGVATSKGVTTETREFGAIGRQNVRVQSVKHALSRLLQALTAN